jgi:hypothetical protein
VPPALFRPPLTLLVRSEDPRSPRSRFSLFPPALFAPPPRFFFFAPADLDAPPPPLPPPERSDPPPRLGASSASARPGQFAARVLTSAARSAEDSKRRANDVALATGASALRD